MILYPDTSRAIPWFFCAKCGRLARLLHHKGCDKYLSRFSTWIRVNYTKWLDCVRLCDDCHEEIHIMYLDDIQTVKHNTPELALKLRQLLIQRCDDWLAGKAKSGSRMEDVPTSGSERVSEKGGQDD